MNPRPFKVIRLGPLQQVPSTKAENNVQYKREYVLQSWGDDHGDTFVGTAWGNLAQCCFQAGDFVFANLEFRTHEYQGVTYQNVNVLNITKIKIS